MIASWSLHRKYRYYHGKYSSYSTYPERQSVLIVGATPPIIQLLAENRPICAVIAAHP
jgi:hypothetical protein